MLKNMTLLDYVKLFGIYIPDEEKIRLEKKIPTLEDLKEMPENCLFSFSRYTKENCETILKMKNRLEQEYNIYQPHQILDFSGISNDSLVITDNQTRTRDLILNRLVSSGESCTFYNISDLSISNLKSLLSYQNKKGQYALSKINKIGEKAFKSVLKGLLLYKEQLLRQSKEFHQEKINLFTLNQDAKKEIVMKEIESYIDYLEANAFMCVWGKNDSKKIALMRKSLMGKNEKAKENKENMINTFTNYMTLSELKSGVIRNRTLDRFIEK